MADEYKPSSARMAELLKGEKYLRLLLESSPEIILLLDENGRIAYCTDALLRLAGISGFAEISGKPFQHLYRMFGDEEFVRQAVLRFEKVKVGHKTVAKDISIDFSGKGENRMYTVQTAPMLDENGSFDGVLAMYYDTTDLRNAEADLRTHILLDATPLASTFWDDTGNMLDCNEEALRMFGVSNKSEYLNHLLDLSPEYQPDGSLSRVKMAAQDKEVMESGYLRTEWMHRTLSGEPLPVEVTLVRVPWKDSYGLATYCRDLRKIKATEQKVRDADERSRELEIQTRAAQVASKAKSQFLASMSHEIRTPMNAIIGMSDLMPTENLDKTQIGYLDDIKKMSRALLHIINDILDFSKIEAGKMELVPVHYNLMELYDNICSMGRFLAESKELEFRCSFDPDVPHVIFGDDTRLRQIITNLVNNAIKYTRKGFVEFQVQLTAKGGSNRLAFLVRDSGIGIKEENFSRLFKSFEQVDMEKNRGIVGTGLGLSITRNLVSLMEGEITVESEYGKGSVFTVLLPFVEGDSGKIENPGIAAFSIEAKGARVLVVDDNKINLKVAVAYLTRHNIQADTAAGGAAAIEMLMAQPYDLVFMDHMMPDMDGVEASRLIRAMGGFFATLPIIALSANAVAGARAFFIDAGMNDFISKPIDPGALNAMLLKWLPPEKVSVTEKPVEKKIEAQNDAVLDIKAGLHYAEDESVYCQLLADFKAGHDKDDEKIAALLEAGDFASAHRVAHTLKSTAAFIGAERLRKTAAAVEAELAEGSHKRAAVLLDALRTEFSALRAELRAHESDCPPPVPEREAGKLNKLAALDLAERLAPLLEAGNAGSLGLIGEIKETLAPLGPQAFRLAEQMEDFSFADALDTLDSLKQAVLSRGEI
ncbi:ATP-binding protein [Leadbettera azotonutricia]|uniref:Sensory/regulatory protein RpfC n=1 Tax=Leadbettera azotonutricia (strain ATCC BAA-888 / DSM 13862 / ZAS-9) TaxID=545695 RepID=F5Y8V1_LEAAZ|nr:ATP-binding protein [Leadbettera azotonutricia]AEF82631.1 multi-sensor hybrid histidine kinase [Leadbettera azotonutricia ZAS-9]